MSTARQAAFTADRPERRYAWGAELLAPDITHFRLWAPNAVAVDVLLADGATHAMQAEHASGWFSIELPYGDGTHYRYRVSNLQGGTLTIPDPASRSQLDSVHGDSIVTDPHRYVWRNPHWHGRPWHESILYELHLGAVGGFVGAREKLAALAAMGFTAIELMPIASFPGNRNWGYDGVLQYAPHFSYGTPDELKALIDEAHTLGLMMFLDVVYNHFGPDGNYLNHYAPDFFDENTPTPWGEAIDFSQPEVRSFYTDNALYWLGEFRFDGLRFDACHAIFDQSWLTEAAQAVRRQLGGERHIHLVAENDNNSAQLLSNGFDAQWNDDGHHVLHLLLTGEAEGYYADYADNPAAKLARCLAEGFIYQGERSAHRDNKPRGEVSAQLPPTAFVLFLQNHDQIGNRPFGERLTTLLPAPALRAANALLLLCPQIPMLFMGEEFGATQPFLYFTSHENTELITAIREGRRKEFGSFEKFKQSNFAQEIPDPNHVDTFTSSIPRPINAEGTVVSAAPDWSQWTSQLLGIRHQAIIPRLQGARALGAEAIGPAAVWACWQMGDGTRLTLAVNLSAKKTALSLAAIGLGEQPNLLFEYGDAMSSLKHGSLPGYSFIALLEKSLEAPLRKTAL